ncbi:hypothetical protein BDY17DRAFT_303789 [Neohortaea acidophila]|uniref:Uncharacterized protein n=1 Tax=Neohortaea acidophila TaxID=245834 RepID=A0A6A6PIN9_9PEZI|nr:uncharacterized protein BDY17DRAFT_303789 [Neohortaea acidophila]KAF2479393.1 hypothetical protein BDY17DRAFT_303789 [Neohortaea acidophila]
MDCLPATRAESRSLAPDKTLSRALSSTCALDISLLPHRPIPLKPRQERPQPRCPACRVSHHPLPRKPRPGEDYVYVTPNTHHMLV